MAPAIALGLVSLTALVGVAKAAPLISRRWRRCWLRFRHDLSAYLLVSTLKERCSVQQDRVLIKSILTACPLVFAFHAWLAGLTMILYRSGIEPLLTRRWYFLA